MTFTKPFLTIWETLPCLFDLLPKGWQSYARVEWPLFPMSVEKIQFWQVYGHISQGASQKNAGLGCFLDPWHGFRHQKHKSDFKQIFIGKPGDRDQFPEVMLKEYTGTVKTGERPRARSQMVSAIKHLSPETDKKCGCSLLFTPGWVFTAQISRLRDVSTRVPGWMNGQEWYQEAPKTKLINQRIGNEFQWAVGLSKRVETKFSSMVATERERK